MNYFCRKCISMKREKFEDKEMEKSRKFVRLGGVIVVLAILGMIFLLKLVL